MKRKLVILSLAISTTLSLGTGFTTAHAIGLENFGLNTSLGWGTGKFGSAQDSIASRTINDLGIVLSPTVKLDMLLSGLAVGPRFEYHFTGQNTAAADVGNTNVKGRGYLLGLATGYTLLEDRLSLNAGLDFFGRYSLSKTNIAGQDVSYKNALGFNLSAGWQVIKGLSVDLGFIWTKYTTVTAGTTDSALDTDRVRAYAFRLGATYRFF